MQVEELVQEDSHVDRYPMLVKGESKVVWEWQGMQVDSVLCMWNCEMNTVTWHDPFYLLLAKHFLQEHIICEIGSSMERRVHSNLAWQLSFYAVEGSLSSMRRMKRGESSTLKLSKSTEISSDQHLHSLKDG